MAIRTFKCQSCGEPNEFLRQGAGTHVIELTCGHFYTFTSKAFVSYKKFKDSGMTPVQYFGDKLWSDHAILDEIPDNWQGPASRK